ncbi:MAG: response regulator [Planctomycetaceae bacterium]|jgi:signal transduction histidine kinase/CheY-like chemotaxis protein|nr:response regulator [Planctomycetaceae bacterium]
MFFSHFFRQPWHLTYRLGVLVVVPILALFAIVYISDIESNRSETAKYRRREMVNEITAHARYLDMYLLSMISRISRFAVILSIKPPENIDELKDAERVILRENPLFYGISVAWEPYSFAPNEKYCCPYFWRDTPITNILGDIHGIENDSKTPETNPETFREMMFSDKTAYNYLDGRDWYDLPKKLYPTLEHSLAADTVFENAPSFRMGVWTSPTWDGDVWNVYTCSYASPIFKDRQFSGVVALDITVDWIREFLDTIPIKGGRFLVVAPDLTIVSHPTQAWVAKNLKEIVEKHNPTGEWKDIIAVLQQIAEQHQDIGGKPYGAWRDIDMHIPALSRTVPGLTTSEPVYLEAIRLPTTQWVLLYTIPEKDAKFYLFTLPKGNILLFLGGLLFIGTMLCWRIGRYVIQPIQILIAGTTEIANGNYDVQIQIKQYVSREMRFMEQNFNAMTAVLRRNIEIAVQHAAAREAAESSNQMKTQLLMVIGHELRTPLNGVIGTADMLLQTELNEKQKDYAVLTRESGLMLYLLIDNILDFTKREDRGIELDEKPFHLRKLLEQTRAFLVKQAQFQNNTIRIEVENELEDHFLGDKKRIRQALLNLLNNAIKFSQNNEILIKVHKVHHFVAADEKNPVLQIRFDVCDNGIGIDKEKLATLFQRDSTADMSSNRQYDGMRIGLSVTKMIIEAMNGTLGAESELGKGSTFHFTIPLSPVPEDVHPNALVKIATDKRSFLDSSLIIPLPKKPLKILIAEDNRINQIVIKEMLAKENFETFIVDNGKKAVDEFLEKGADYDLILMDCQMPVMDGYEATEQIRHREFADCNSNGTCLMKHQIPIIALTANAAPGDKERCLSIGMNAYCNKPVNAQELLALIVQLTG